MRISHQLFQNFFQVPVNWQSMPTYKLFEKTGLVTFLQAGFPTFLPVGQRLVNGVNNVIREEAVRAGFEEVCLPLVQNELFLKETGRADQFGEEFFRIPDKQLILSPTNEEIFIYLCSKAKISYRQLPIKMFQIADKFRNIKKPKGVFRSKEFLMCDMVSIDADEAMLHESAMTFERVAEAVFRRLEVNVVRVEKKNGKYVDFLVECQEGTVFIAHNPSRFQNGGVSASSVGMYFLFDHHGPEFRGCDNSFITSYVGTYGFGIQRCIHAVIEQHRDKLGIAFPKSMRPFDSSIILLNPAESRQRDLAEECYRKLLDIGAKPLFDDRFERMLKEKASLADFFGIPFKLIIGDREAETGKVMLKWRDGRIEFVQPDKEAFARILS
ncbi:MAG: aminoacyl--tRNA ligase-related protein [Nitrosomonas sp.]|nr:aminoacyl--tRNA ligase-related protein [Nitrosomonas sp.]